MNSFSCCGTHPLCADGMGRNRQGLLGCEFDLTFLREVCHFTYLIIEYQA